MSTPLATPDSAPSTDAQTTSLYQQQSDDAQLAEQSSPQIFSSDAAATPGEAHSPTAGTSPTTLHSTNTFAVLAIVLAFLQPIAAIVFGHIGLSQIKKNGDGGRGIALTGTILGYVFTLGALVFVMLYVGFFVAMGILAGASTGFEMDPLPYD